MLLFADRGCVLRPDALASFVLECQLPTNYCPHYQARCTFPRLSHRDSSLLRLVLLCYC